jgi:hypothetical protein
MSLQPYRSLVLVLYEAEKPLTVLTGAPKLATLEMNCQHAAQGEKERKASTSVVFPIPAAPVTNTMWRVPSRAHPYASRGIRWHGAPPGAFDEITASRVPWL